MTGKTVYTFYVNEYSLNKVLEKVKKLQDSFDPETARLLIKKLTIEAGVPHNDYGQTVTIEFRDTKSLDGKPGDLIFGA